MFVDLDWPLNASSLLSASAELLVCQDQDQDFYLKTKTKTKTLFFVFEAPRDQDFCLKDYITGS